VEIRDEFIRITRSSYEKRRSEYSIIKTFVLFSVGKSEDRIFEGEDLSKFKILQN